MWDHTIFKTRAKAIMKEHYWPVFFACLIATLLGATGSNGNNFNVEFNSNSGLGMNLGVGPLNQSIPLSLIGAALSIMIIFMALAAFACATLLNSFVFNILRVGFCRYLVLTQRYGRPAEIGEIFWGFGCGHYLNLVKTMFFRDLYVFLWSLALVIPGIIKNFAYTCVPYLLAEHPDMDYREVLALSTTMTDGYKVDIWILGLSFIGWELLGVLLLGIGSFFVTPYVQLTYGEMYAFLRSRMEPDHDGYSYHDPNQTEYHDYGQGYTY